MKTRSNDFENKIDFKKLLYLDLETFETISLTIPKNEIQSMNLPFL
jgi:hypothetical protein